MILLGLYTIRKQPLPRLLSALAVVTCALIGASIARVVAARSMPVQPVQVVDADRTALLLHPEGDIARVVSSEIRVGAGPALRCPVDVAWDAAAERALVVDRCRATLVAIDGVNGDRTELSSASIGAGPLLTCPAGVAWDAAAQRALVVDECLGTLLVIDADSGDRMSLPMTAATQVLPLIEPVGVAWDASQLRVLAVDVVGSVRRGALLSVDVTTGEQTLLSW